MFHRRKKPAPINSPARLLAKRLDGKGMKPTSIYKIRKFSPVIQDAQRLRELLLGKLLLGDETPQTYPEALDDSTIYFSGRLAKWKPLFDESDNDDTCLLMWIIEASGREFIYLANERDVDLSIAKHDLLHLDPESDPMFFETLDFSHIIGEIVKHKDHYHFDLADDSPVRVPDVQ